MTAARKRATYADVLAAPEHKVVELIDGELFVQPRPALRHTNAASVVGSDVHDAFHRGRSGPGGWWIFFEPELWLGEDVLVPDVAGWRREQMPVLELEEGPGIRLAPSWICEVLSPSTAAHDRRRKLPVYARAGIAHAWLVDPLARTLEAYALESGRWSLLDVHGDEGSARIAPFDAVELELAPIFATS